MRKLAAALSLVALLAAACSSSAQKAQGSDDVLRLGIFPNLTHAPGYVALEEGFFEEALPGVEVAGDVLQLRFGRRRGDLRRLDRRHLHRSRSRDVAVPRARARGRGRVGGHLRRRVVRRAQGRRASPRPTTSSARRSPCRGSGTRRTSRSERG